MRKSFFILSGIFVTIFLTAFTYTGDDAGKPVYIPASQQRSGDAAKGYIYLTTGDFIKSGFPYDFFLFTNKDSKNYLNRDGKAANVGQGYNVVMNADSMAIVIPTCLQCHAQVFEGKLYVGLGNSMADFSNFSEKARKLSVLKMWQTTSPKKYAAVRSLLRSLTTVNPLMETEVQGVNSADRLAALLVAHRDPQTLVWTNDALLDIPEGVIPTDVPAWWLLKKKNAMFYNGFGRGDFGKFLMLSNILTVKDSAEATEVDSHFGDVLAYINSIQPPKYPRMVNMGLVREGAQVFMNNCQGCHGTYGAHASYPNLLIPGSIIKTDDALFKANQQNSKFIDWFNRSWFSQGANPARIVPSDGYVAPPLDGVWITAPYLHNGSVPTLEAVLNSKIRPAYWSRDFDNPVYDYEHVGWQYKKEDAPGGKKIYNTTLQGYGNGGHYFGDELSDKERKAVIEYLKTL